MNSQKELKQKIFDYVVDKLAAQGERSIFPGSHLDPDWAPCQYRGSSLNGRDVVFKCAVGHLMPDNMYEKAFELNDVHSLHGKHGFDFRRAIQETLGLDIRDFGMDNDSLVSFLSKLQFAHDNSRTLLEFKSELNEVCLLEDLDNSLVDKVKTWN